MKGKRGGWWSGISREAPLARLHTIAPLAKVTIYSYAISTPRGTYMYSPAAITALETTQTHI